MYIPKDRAPGDDLMFSQLRFCPMSNVGVEPLAGALCSLQVLLFDGCKVSTLGAARLLRSHPNRYLRCWKLGVATLCKPSRHIKMRLTPTRSLLQFTPLGNL